MSIADALRVTRQQHPIEVSRVAVAVCPPISRWRIRADRVLPDALLRLCGWKSDFVRTMVTDRFLTFEDYWNQVGNPVDRTLDAIGGTGCIVRRDVSFRRFVALCRSGEFDLLFLVAHHITGNGVDAPEFADGPRQFEEIRSIAGGDASSLVMFLCESADWRDGLVTQSVHRMAAGGAPFRMPFLESMLFLLFCLRQFDGRRALDEALDRATRTFLDRPDNGEPYD